MLRRIKHNLTSLDYYFGQLALFIPSLFLIVFWQFLASAGQIPISKSQIWVYFLFVGAFSFIFFYDLIGLIIARLEKVDRFLLDQQHPLKTIIKSDLFPLIINQMPAISIVALLAWTLDILNLSNFSHFVLALIFNIWIYTMLCVEAAIIAILFSFKFWMAFFLRFTGAFWSGAWIPLLLLPDGFLQLALKFPFIFAGLPLQYILQTKVPLPYWSNTLIYGSLFTFLALYLLNKYRQYVQS